MLLPRIITALILIPLVLGGILYLPPVVFALVAAALFILAANEWADFCDMSSLKKRLGYILVTCLLMAIFYFSKEPLPIIGLGSLLWILPTLCILFYQPEKFHILQNRSVRAVIGFFTLSLAWYALVTLRELAFGPLWLLLLCFIVWATDIFAYFAGRKWGKRKLAPLISPGKTWAGFWGGLFGSLAVASLLFVFLQNEHFFSKPAFFTLQNLPLWAGIGCVTILLAVIGDLFESLMKRLAGVKDSGNLLPGHGGILDRIDSLISTLPVYCLFVLCVTRFFP